VTQMLLACIIAFQLPFSIIALVELMGLKAH